MVTKEMIKNSMEAEWRKRDAIILLVLPIIIFVVNIGLTAGGSEKSNTLGIGYWAIASGGFSLYFGIRYWLLFLHRESYKVYAVKLDRPTSSYIEKGSVYFTVMIETESGINIFRKTKHIWSDYFFSKFKTWEYMNSTVLIAYDEERDRLVVLRSKDDWRSMYERNNSN